MESWDEMMRDLGVSETALTEADSIAAAEKAKQEMLDVIETFPGKDDIDELARWVLGRAHVLPNDVAIDAYCAGIRPQDLIPSVLAQIMILEDSWDRMCRGIANDLGKRAEARVCKHLWEGPQMMRLLGESLGFFQTCSLCGEERQV